MKELKFLIHCRDWEKVSKRMNFDKMCSEAQPPDDEESCS